MGENKYKRSSFTCVILLGPTGVTSALLTISRVHPQMKKLVLKCQIISLHTFRFSHNTIEHDFTAQNWRCIKRFYTKDAKDVTDKLRKDATLVLSPVFAHTKTKLEEVLSEYKEQILDSMCFKFQNDCKAHKTLLKISLDTINEKVVMHDINGLQFLWQHSTATPMQVAQAGMDLKLNLDRPATSSQMDTIFDPLFTSFEGKLKLMDDDIPSPSDVDMNIPQARDPVPFMRKTISFKQNLDRLDGLTDFISNTPSGVNDAPRVTRERERLCSGDQPRSSGLESEVNGASSYFVNAETHSQTLPFIVPDLGDFNSGTYDCSRLPHERRHKWMVRNRGAPARSTARRLGRLENCQVKKQRLDELD